MEQVFVVDRTALFGGDWPQGFVALDGDDASRLLDRAFSRGRFVERAEAERTPSWKQWIPYCGLCCGGEGVEPGLFVVQRTGGQSEARLHGSWSIGLGGHIGPEDVGTAAAGSGPAGFFAAALRRELTEELFFEGNTLDMCRIRLVGMINDDSTAVGQVHAGLAYCLELPTPLADAREQVRIREISKMRGGFTSLVEFAELWQDPTRFESWSQVFIRAGRLAAMGGTNWRNTVQRDTHRLGEAPGAGSSAARDLANEP